MIPKEIVIEPLRGDSHRRTVPLSRVLKVTDVLKSVWIDASDTSSIVNVNGGAAQINDKSGNNANLIQNNSGRRPRTGTRSINTLNVLDLQFNQFMECKTNFKTPASGDMMVFCVGEHVGPSAHETIGGLWGMSGPDLNLPILSLIPYNRTENDCAILYGSHKNGYWGSFFDGKPYNDAAIFEVTSSRHEPILRKFVNGTPKGTTSHEERWTPDVMEELYIGRNSFTSKNNTVPCMIGELIVIPFHSHRVRQLMEGYLAWKWGFDLPNKHPYYLNPPKI